MISDPFRCLILICATVFKTAILFVADFASELCPHGVATGYGLL